MTETDLRRLLQSSPFHDLFGLELVRADAESGHVEILMRVTRRIERIAGSGQIHGGALATLIDIAGNFAATSMVGTGVPTINLRIDYLRPAGGAALLAVASVRRAGRAITLVDIDVRDDRSRLVALGRGTFGTVPVTQHETP